MKNLCKPKVLDIPISPFLANSSLIFETEDWVDMMLPPPSPVPPVTASKIKTSKNKKKKVTRET